MPTRHHHRLTRGFTLIEVTTSLAIVGVLMLGLSSAIMLAAHAIPDPTDSGEYDRQVIDTLNQLRDDARDATQITIDMNSTRVRLELSLNDTGGLGAPGSVEYNYVIADEELYRKADNFSNTLMLNNVGKFNLTTTIVNSKPAALHVVLQVPESIQQLYEVHALLPEEPVIK